MEKSTIKELRNRESLSQSQFANKYHLSVKTLQRWERGQTTTPEHVLYLVQTIQNLEALLAEYKLPVHNNQRKEQK